VGVVGVEHVDQVGAGFDGGPGVLRLCGVDGRRRGVGWREHLGDEGWLFGGDGDRLCPFPAQGAERFGAGVAG
jgi:hypothetical protein